MAARPLISIIIPTYDGGHYLVEAIKSALAQDYPHTEIIVVDDGSPTDIESLLGPFNNKVKLVTQENAGPGAARNLGAQESRGEFLAFLDHDDLWAPEKLSEQLARMTGNPKCGLVYSYPCLMDESGQKIPNIPPSDFPVGRVLEDFIRRNRITTFSATLIRRTAFWEVGGIDESPEFLTCDDYDLWLRLAAHWRVEFAPGPLVHYRIHEGNLLNNHHINLSAHLAVLHKCKTMLQTNPDIAISFDMDHAITENEFGMYKKFGLIFYFDFPASNLAARKAFKEALSRKGHDVWCWLYFLFTYPPLVWYRHFKRKSFSLE